MNYISPGMNRSSLLQGSQSEINDQLLSILDSLYDGLYITDGNAVTILINHAYQTISGLTPEDVLGRSMWDIVADGLINQSGTLCVLKTKAPITLEQTFRTGKKALITSTPHFDKEGRITMVITVVRDITELYDLQKKYQESEERHRLEKDFLRRSQKFSSKLLVNDPRTKAALARAQKVAALDTTVLLLGETGVGKEQFAHLIYEHSNRADQSFISVNCGAIPPTLIESELFGYERGAFTGALNTGRPGLVERADGGTLFLDEINSLPLALQGKLLRLLESRRSKRLGAVTEQTLDFRLLCATNQDLKALVDAGRFRADLYYRLSVVPLNLPPLRERREDIIPLALRFLEQFGQKYGRTKVFTQGVFDQLLAYDWPGNVRELRNVVERLVITSSAGTVEIYQAPDNLISGGSLTPAAVGELPLSGEWPVSMEDAEFSLSAYLEQCERAVLAQALRRFGSTYRAAKYLGVNQSTVARKKQKYGL